MCSKYNCYVALSVNTVQVSVEIALACKHTSTSHLVSSGILSVKQRSAFKRAVRSALQAVGSQVQAIMENSSPDKRIPCDSRGQNAVSMLVRNERRDTVVE